MLKRVAFESYEELRWFLIKFQMQNNYLIFLKYTKPDQRREFQRSSQINLCTVSTPFAEERNRDAEIEKKIIIK